VLLQIPSHLLVFLILRPIPQILLLMILLLVQTHVIILEIEPPFMHPTGLVFSLLVLLVNLNLLHIRRQQVIQFGSRLCPKNLQLWNVLVLGRWFLYLHMLSPSHANGFLKLRTKLMNQLNDTKLA